MVVEGRDLAWTASALGLTEARIRLIRLMTTHDEMTVSELHEASGLSGTTIRWHLAQLTKAGVLTRHPETSRNAQGRWSIVPEQLERLRQLTRRLI